MVCRLDRRTVVTFPLTFGHCFGRSKSLAHLRTPFAKVFSRVERVRCLRAERYTPLPGGSGHLPRRYYGRCVRCCHWTGTGERRVTPAGTASQEARPGVEPLGPASLWQEPRWNADRRARSVERAPHLRVRRWLYTAPVGVPLPSFFPVSETKKEGRNSWLSWCLLKQTRMRRHRENELTCPLGAVMAGLVPDIPINVARCPPYRDRRNKSDDDGPEQNRKRRDSQSLSVRLNALPADGHQARHR